MALPFIHLFKPEPWVSSWSFLCPYLPYPIRHKGLSMLPPIYLVNLLPFLNPHCYLPSPSHNHLRDEVKGKRLPLPFMPLFSPFQSILQPTASVRIFFNVYLFWGEREHTRAWVGEGQRERETEDSKQALHWQQKAQCGTRTHEPWDHDLSWNQTLNRLSHPSAPLGWVF